MDTTQDGLNTQHELLHREWLGDIVIGTNLEAFEDIVLEGTGGKEDDRNLGVGLTNLLGQGESVFLGHHHVENGDVELALGKLSVADLTILAENCLITFGL